MLASVTVHAAWPILNKWWSSAPKLGLLTLLTGVVTAISIGLWAKVTRASNYENGFRILPWWIVVVGLLAAVAATWGSIAWLTSAARGNASLEFDAIKTGLTVGAGIAGLAALLLGVRKQWLSEQSHKHQEVVARQQEHDSKERRVTELYTKAADQLGHEKAAVRLAGLYALERLGQNQIEHRQTIVNLLCAYLRMSPPEIKLEPEGDSPRRLKDLKETDWNELEQERHVRWAAQDILCRHLQHGQDAAAPPATFWAEMDIDLSYARLIRVNFNNCTFGRADFSGATFDGKASFARVRFFEHAKFTKARFEGTARFNDASFASGASFLHAHFRRMSDFRTVRFNSSVNFYRALFGSETSFQGSNFTAGLNFGGAEFLAEASFQGVTTARRTDFSRTKFVGPVTFLNARFCSDSATAQASFVATQFCREANFTSSVFQGKSDFVDARFAGKTTFIAAHFYGETKFHRAQFERLVRFDGCKFRKYAGFGGVDFTRTQFNSVTFDENVSFNGATFYGTSWFGESTFHGKIWFQKVEAISAPRFTHATFIGGASFDLEPVPVILNGARAHGAVEHHWPSGWKMSQIANVDGFHRLME